MAVSSASGIRAPILTNLTDLANIYGYHDSNDPERLGGCGRLIEEKIRNPIRGTWGYEYSNFKLQPEARLNIFGYSTQDLFHC